MYIIASLGSFQILSIAIDLSHSATTTIYIPVRKHTWVGHLCVRLSPLSGLLEVWRGGEGGGGGGSLAWKGVRHGLLTLN